ncbi:winged helix DNA-binding domain-containing protein [Catenuloplanes japonicus]|uniref:winged helix DNA-binding domain-containing protein n=1 Tax=Catenuloplanes japonicus TaxID=33876 RepID=UPI0005244FC3|nr:winged helix DNA-binding domain-containing protein [Catenuloplanes japonicus]
MRHVGDGERRARLGVRQALAPGFRAGSAEEATRAVTVLHATEPPTVYLSCHARVDGLTRADVDDALYTARSLVKQLAMRRTLFVFPRDLLPSAWPSASARAAATERARMAKDVVLTGITTDGDAWLDRARAEVLAVLDGLPGGLPAQEIRKAVPFIDVKVEGAELWSASRVLTHLGLTADLVRGTNTGGWHVSRPRWTPMRDWLGAMPPWPGAADGYREIVRRWLRSFGPGTEADLVWWLGSTKAVVRAALAEIGAVQVSLDGGGTGWLLPDDVDEVPDPGPWAALLPVLDPTIMGWQGRDFYLGPHKQLIFDTRGNAGTTAWANGRVVGVWTQDPAGVVELRLVEAVSTEERAMLDAEAARLTDWLGGFRVNSLYKSPAMKTAPV